MFEHQFGCILPHGGPSSQWKIDSPIFFRSQGGCHSWLWFSQSSWLDYIPLHFLMHQWCSLRTPSIVKSNNPLSPVWYLNEGPQNKSWKAFQCVAISYWSNGFLANEEYENISLKADVSLSLIGREKRSRVRRRYLVWFKYDLFSSLFPDNSWCPCSSEFTLVH